MLEIMETSCSRSSLNIFSPSVYACKFHTKKYFKTYTQTHAFMYVHAD